MSTPLNRAALGLPVPPVRLVHLGLGAFFRAHQAWYTQHAEADPADPQWGYAAFTGRSPATAELLAAQDGLYTLVERAGELAASLIGINNRNLNSLAVDLATTERLAPLAPPAAMLVGESGISSHADCKRLERAGVHAFLVGESLMRQPDVEAATRELLGGH